MDSTLCGPFGVWRLNIFFLAWNGDLCISFMCSVHIYCADAWPGTGVEGWGRTDT